MNVVCRRGMHELCDGRAYRADLGGIGPCLCPCYGARTVPKLTGLGDMQYVVQTANT
jgi:hypothetical protein